jgi:hypothetical protein
LEHFSIGEDLIPREMITAYATLKQSAANANHAANRLDYQRHGLIVRAWVDETEPERGSCRTRFAISEQQGSAALRYLRGDTCMDTTTINSADPKVHSQHIQEMLRDVIDHARQDLDKVNEPRFQALLETTAEVLTGLQTAFAHYSQGDEKAWKR